MFGQCSLADLKEMDALVDGLDAATFQLLSKKQKLAILVLAAFEAAQMKRSDSFVVREILFWEEGRIEMKFLDVARAERIYKALLQPLRQMFLSKSFSDILSPKEEPKWYEQLSKMSG